ncbi:hypothetical protein [Trinickia sp.]|uniref:hypothetical protein n=1 Tax=Trinickia sp. TaxID=2571163 RepID=UPI003F81DE54
MKRSLVLTAAGTVLAWHGLAGAAQPSTLAAPPAGPSSSPGSSSAGTERGWGNAPAAGNAVRLAEPPAPSPSEHALPTVPPRGARRSVSPRTPAHAKPATPAQSLGCRSLPAKWREAQQLADAGQFDQAYAAYAALLHECSGVGEREGTAWKAAKALPAAYMERLLADAAFDAPKLRKTRTDIELQQMYAENTAGSHDRALAYSRSLRADPSVKLDAAALEVSGWLEEEAHDDLAAERLFREALAGTTNPESARQGLALSLMHQGRLEEAQAQSSQLTSPDGRRLNAQVALARAKASGDPAQVDAALTLIDETGGASDSATRALVGWALLSSQRPARAEDIFRALHRQDPDNAEYSQGLAYAAAAARDYAALDALVAENKPGTPAQARESLAEHDARLALYSRARSLVGHPMEGQGAAVQGLFGLDRKSGAAGQDKLTVWTMPQLSATLLPTPTLTVQIDAALLRLDNDVRHAWGKQFGAAARTDWHDGALSFGAAVEAPGRAPEQWLGKIRYQRYAQNEQSFVRLTAARDGIYDSLRAYEGTAAGLGPAISSSLELAAGQPIGGTAWHVAETLAGGVVMATGTAFNPFYSVSLGLTRDFFVKGWSWLNTGPDLRFSSYRYDANRFDGPYAGYWSPKSNREAGLVFNAQTQEGGRLLFKTGARVGYATRELYTGRASGAFGEDTTTLAGLVATNLIMGASVGFRASPGYRDLSVIAWLKLPLDARAHLRVVDLVTPRGF